MLCFVSVGLLFAILHHPLQDVEDADAVNGNEGGKVRRDVDLLQGVSCHMEGLQGLTRLHVPPLANTQRKREISEMLLKCSFGGERIVFTYSQLVLVK